MANTNKDENKSSIGLAILYLVVALIFFANSKYTRPYVEMFWRGFRDILGITPRGTTSPHSIAWQVGFSNGSSCGRSDRNNGDSLFFQKSEEMKEHFGTLYRVGTPEYGDFCAGWDAGYASARWQ